MAKRSKHRKKKIGRNKKPITLPCLKITQGSNSIFVFAMKASLAWEIFSISRKEPEGNKGYQRFLSESRVASVSNYIKAGNPIPVSVLISIDDAKFNKSNSTITIPRGSNVGWIIDGQHRLAGASEAATDNGDIELIIAAFIGLDEKDQVKQFVTINDEAKGVPRSLLLNLLNQIPDKTLQQQANERAIDLAKALNSSKSSVFFQRIAALESPKTGQISDTNFVRKLAPLVHPEKGLLRIYPLLAQTGILENYYTAIRDIFPEEFRKSKSVFFRTIGFGALMNAFEEIFTRVLSEHGTFAVSDIKKVIKGLSDYDPSGWEELGTGNKAEQLAAANLLTKLRKSLKATKAASSDSNIRL